MPPSLCFAALASASLTDARSFTSVPVSDRLNECTVAPASRASWAISAPMP
jgi:hypothetical protein